VSFISSISIIKRSEAPRGGTRSAFSLRQPPKFFANSTTRHRVGPRSLVAGCWRNFRLDAGPRTLSRTLAESKIKNQGKSGSIAISGRATDAGKNKTCQLCLEVCSCTLLLARRRRSDPPSLDVGSQEQNSAYRSLRFLLQPQTALFLNLYFKNLDNRLSVCIRIEPQRGIGVLI